MISSGFVWVDIRMDDARPWLFCSCRLRSSWSICASFYTIFCFVLFLRFSIFFWIWAWNLGQLWSPHMNMPVIHSICLFVRSLNSMFRFICCVCVCFFVWFFFLVLIFFRRFVHVFCHMRVNHRSSRQEKSKSKSNMIEKKNQPHVNSVCHMQLPVKMNHYCLLTERIPDRRATQDWTFSSWGLGSSRGLANLSIQRNEPIT